jgi:hypothetical protein
MTNDDNNSPPKGYLQRLIDYFHRLGWEDSRIAQAILILGICALGGLLFIAFFALQTPYQMTLYSNTTNTTLTTPPTLTFWDSVLTVLSVFGAGVLIAGASFFIGGFLGFLFGIPKTVKLQSTSGSSPPPSGENREMYTENTNLEDVSDWLTKIIIGVGLVELTQIPGFINQFAEMIAPALGGVPSSGPFGIAILVYYSLIGFLMVYLATRGYMEDELESKKRRELSIAKLEKMKEEENLDKLKIEAQSEFYKRDIKENEHRRLNLEQWIQQDQEKWKKEQESSGSEVNKKIDETG